MRGSRTGGAIPGTGVPGASSPASPGPVLSAPPPASADRWQVTRQVISLAYPVVLSMLATTLMGLTDTLFMGRVSTAAQGGVGLGAIMVWACVSFFYGTLTVVNTFVAQLYGAGRPRECGAVAWHGAAITLGFAAMAIAIAPLAPRLVQLFGAHEQVAPIAARYALIRLAGSPLALLDACLTSFMRGIGDTRTPMKVALASVALNVPLTYWFVFGGLGLPPLGTDGAAYATVISSGVAAALLVIIFLSARLRSTYRTGLPRRLEVRRLGELLRVGLPIGVGWSLEMVTWLIFTAMVANLGKVALAAHHIVMQVLHVSFMPGVGISVAATTLVGQRIGASDRQGAHAVARATLRLAMIFMGMMGLVFLLFGGPIARTFNPEETVVSAARPLFALAAAFQLFDAMGMVSCGVLRGAGDTRWPMAVGVLCAWLVFVPMIWLLGLRLGHGVTGAWAAATIYICLLGLVFHGRVRSGRWSARSLVKEELPAGAALPLSAAPLPPAVSPAARGSEMLPAPGAPIETGGSGERGPQDP